MTFYRGQKVVCVDISGGVDTEGLRLKEYEVSCVEVTFRGTSFIGVDGMTVNGDPAPWLASRFRPLVERKTDISVFTAMLDRSRQTERA